MQVIISLLKLQAQSITDPYYLSMFKECEDRIRSMTLVHEKLYQTENFSDVDIKAYVKSLVTSLFRSYGGGSGKINLILDVEKVFLGMESAIPCGLIINELVSNSLKYAFPRSMEGRISVAMNIDDNDYCTIEVSDDGIGLPQDYDINNTHSMGLHLVSILAQDQLKGTLEIDRSNGTRFHIYFKKHTYKARI